jgi:hypothetical protein
MVVPVLALAVERSAADGREHEQHSIWFVHATDPHIFVPAAQNPDKDVKAVGEKQQELSRKALKDMLQRIRSLPEGDGPPAFVVMTGNFGVDPCDIAKGENQATAHTPANKNDQQDKSSGGGASAKDCASDPGKRKEQIKQLAQVLGASPVQDIYLVAGNNDVAQEAPDDSALGYFNQIIEDVQKKILDNKSGVRLHNLTNCYASSSVASTCYADISGTAYRLIGFPSHSFKNAKADNKDAQLKQFETFRGLLDQARQSGKRVLIITHIPEIDDPYTLAQDRYAGKPPAKVRDEDSNNSRSLWSTWNVNKKLLDDWNDAVATDFVVGVLAGHLDDSHKEIYRQPYAWSTVNDRRAAFRKLFLAPPLAVKNQDTSPIQARGFALVRLEPDRIESRLYWYNSETGDFGLDRRPEDEWQRPRRWHWPRAIMWLWGLDEPEKALDRMAVLLIAFLTAFLTVVAVWQIPPVEDPMGQPTGKTQNTANATSDASPFASRFGKTVIAGLGGLVVTEVTKALGNQQPSADTKWYYIVWFILFFFILLLGLGALRATAEGIRARVAIGHYALARPARRTPSGWARFWDGFSYWLLRIVHWLFSLSVPLLTFLDTLINLIQGKNQTMTRVFADKVIEQQRAVVRVADAIREDLNELIERRVMILRPGLPAAQANLLQRVRVNISVLSADQTSAFYISRTPGSALLRFPKRSVAWVSIFTGEIRWYKSAYGGRADYNTIVLFDNSEGTVAGDEDQILLSTHYQPRHQDYQAFIIFPLPWPQRGYGSDYVKGAIHISFREDADLEAIWTGAPDPAGGPPPSYPTSQRMLEDWCNEDGVRAALRNAIAALSELLRGFNEAIYKNYVEPNQPN